MRKLELKIPDIVHEYLIFRDKMFGDMEGLIHDAIIDGVYNDLVNELTCNGRYMERVDMYNNDMERIANAVMIALRQGKKPWLEEGAEDGC